MGWGGGSCFFKERLPSPSACVAMVSAPPSPPSPLHCALPVAMVTGLSDRWLSLRHGVLSGPAAPPPLPPQPGLPIFCSAHVLCCRF